MTMHIHHETAIHAVERLTQTASTPQEREDARTIREALMFSQKEQVVLAALAWATNRKVTMLLRRSLAYWIIVNAVLGALFVFRLIAGGDNGSLWVSAIGLSLTLICLWVAIVEYQKRYHYQYEGAVERDDDDDD